MTQPVDGLADVGSGRTRQRHQNDHLAGLIAQLGDNVLGIVGVVTSIAEFIGLVTSGQLRKFVKLCPYPICITLIVVLLALLVSLNYTLTLRRQRNQLQAVAQHYHPGKPRPSAHDMRLLAEALTDLPLDGPVITWLRRVDAAALDPEHFPADVLTALERTVGRLERRPVGFDDNVVAQALADFIAAVNGYRASLERWTLVWQNQTWAGAAGSPPPDLDPIGDLAESQQRLLSAYDSFILNAHKRGMDVER